MYRGGVKPPPAGGLRWALLYWARCSWTSRAIRRTSISRRRNAGRIEQVPGGVSRNVVEDIANVELRPTFVSLVDDTGLGEDVVRQLRNHKVNTDYMLRTSDGMGTWLAVFNNDGDVCAAISKRPDLRPLIALLDEKGDEIFRDADSIALELDMDKEIVKRVFAYAKKYHKSVYAVVSNMTIAVERRDFLQQTDCFVCNRQEAGILFVEDFEDKTVEQMQQILLQKVKSANIPRMIVTLGEVGAVYATADGESGFCRRSRPCTRHDRRGRRILRGHHHRLDLRQGDAGCLRPSARALRRRRSARSRTSARASCRANSGWRCRSRTDRKYSKNFLRKV